MKNLLLFVAGIVLAFATLLFSAWVIMEMYNLCILPLSTEHFTFPQIPYYVWLMVYVFIGFVRISFTKSESITLDSKEGILKFVSKIVTMLFYLFIAWILNIIIF